MANQGFKVLDSDMHVLEPADLWQRYIDPAYRDTAPVGQTRYRRDFGVMVNGIRIGSAVGHPAPERARDADLEQKNARYAFAEERGFDGVSQVQAMDMEGIDVTVLFPTRGLAVLGLDTKASDPAHGLKPDHAAAISRAYNDWLRDFCKAAPKRMYGAGLIAPHDVEMAVDEARRCSKELGFKAVFLLPGTVNGRPWHDPYYDPFWAECQRLSLPVVFHGGAPDRLKPDFALGLDLVMTFHTFSHSLGPMFAMVSMTAGGVFQRFPNLRVGYLEANCSWAPWLLWRLDEHFEWRGRFEVPELKAKPSEYYMKNCYVSVEADEEPARWYVEAMGDDNVVFSTDFPHPDAKFPHATERFIELPFTKATKRKFLWDNCARLYGFPIKSANGNGKKRVTAGKAG